MSSPKQLKKNDTRLPGIMSLSATSGTFSLYRSSKRLWRHRWSDWRGTVSSRRLEMQIRKKNRSFRKL